MAFYAGGTVHTRILMCEVLDETRYMIETGKVQKRKDLTTVD